MKKFTLNHNADSDSNKSIQSSQTVNELGKDNQLPRITILNIVIPSLNKQTTLKVIGDALVLDIKRKLLRSFNTQLRDGLNMGLFLPNQGGKMGKFLGEDRLLSDYTGGKAEVDLESLLDFGQSPNAFNREGLTPLFLNILADSDTKICRSLLYEHSPLGVINSNGLQEIHEAARLNRIEQIALLLMYGADVNSICHPPTNDSRTHITVSPVHTNAMGRQIQRGDTPLHLAAAAGQREAVLRLLSWGADPSLTNQKDETAIDLAQLAGHTDLANKIRLFGGTTQSEMDQGSPFLPQPTYNHHRRIQRAPPTSIISDPTSLQFHSPSSPTHTRSLPLRDSPSSNTAANNLPSLIDPNSNQGSTNSSSTCVPTTVIGSYETRCSQTPATGSMARTVSMGNLAPVMASDGQPLQRWINGDLGTTNPTTGPSSPSCGQFFLASQVHYDSTRRSGPMENMTLARNSKLRSNAHHSIAMGMSPPPVNGGYRQMYRTNSVQDPVAAVTTSQPRHFSRLNRGESVHTDLTGFIKSDSPPDEMASEFKREGSQTDSGISNSSTDKHQTHSGNADPNIGGTGTRLLPMTHDHRTHRKEHGTTTATSHQTDCRSKCPPRLDLNERNIGSGEMRYTPDTTSPTTASNNYNYQNRSPILPMKPHTVYLRKATGSGDQKETKDMGFGFSISTVKNADAVRSFKPSPSKPSLQNLTRIMPNLPAYEAGICEGDFLLQVHVDANRYEPISGLNSAIIHTDRVRQFSTQINGHDVSCASHERVLLCIRETVMDAISITVLRPFKPAPTTPLTAVPSDVRDLRSSTVDKRGVSYGLAKPDIFDGSDSSGLSSARSSDRTNCSSIKDEVSGSASSFGTRNNNVNSKATSQQSIPSHPPPIGPDAMIRPYSGDSRPTTQRRVPPAPLPRSRTTGVLSEAHRAQQSTDSPSMARSFHYPRNPRIGSPESRSSCSSHGATMSSNPPTTHRAPGLIRSRSGASVGSPLSASVERKPASVTAVAANRLGRIRNATEPVKLSVIKAERQASAKQSRSRGSSGTEGQQVQVRRYPAHRPRAPSVNHSVSRSGEDTGRVDLILLPPPEFR